MEGGTGMAML